MTPGPSWRSRPYPGSMRRLGPTPVRSSTRHSQAAGLRTTRTSTACGPSMKSGEQLVVRLQPCRGVGGQWAGTGSCPAGCRSRCPGPGRTPVLTIPLRHGQDCFPRGVHVVVRLLLRLSEALLAEPHGRFAEAEETTRRPAGQARTTCLIPTQVSPAAPQGPGLPATPRCRPDRHLACAGAARPAGEHPRHDRGSFSQPRHGWDAGRARGRR